MKLPNGYGNVSKLPGRRRRPWRARKTDGWEVCNGKTKQRYITVGYYETRAEALQALADYNANPYELDRSITFAEVYRRWSEQKFKEISDSNISGYRASYNICSKLYDTPFNEIKLSHLQGIVDASGKNYPALKKLKVLFNQLFDYSVQNEIIGKDKHIVEYLKIGTPTKSDKHYRFTEREIEAIRRWAPKNDYIQVILMLIYTGVRPGEMFALKKKDVNLDECFFRIEKGKNNNAVRSVPIHDSVFEYFEEWMKKPGEYLITQLNGEPINFAENHSRYTDTYWTPLLRDMGILEYKNGKGEIREHRPDDTRHTFTTMWKEKHLDEAMRRKIQGHSGQGIGEMVYTHYEMQKLRDELNKL